MSSTLKVTSVILLLGIILLLVMAGCGGKTEQTTGQAGPGDAVKEIRVLVPCGQMGPFYEIKPLFEQANPNIKVSESVENIDVLTNKILDGIEKAEVFMSMGDLEVTMIEEKGLVVEGTRREYAPNSLALIVNKANPAIEHLEEVAGPAVKTFIMVDPDTSTVGYHAREALTALGIWEKVMEKTTIPKQPSLVGISVAKGDAEAGIAYYPCTTETHQPGAGPTPKKKIVVAEFIPQELYTRFSCTAAVIKGAKNPEEGKKFIAFLSTPESQAIFTKWNFVDPEKQPQAE